MNSSSGSNEEEARPRGGDRRRRDRRKSDRRAPVPPWRRPWAYVGYGVAAALVLVLLFSLGDDDGNSMAATDVTDRTPPPAVDSTALGATGAAVIDAFGESDFAALLAEGEAAQGRRVRTLLYCRPIRQVTLRTGSEIVVNASVAEQADAAGQVPAADCQWGGESSAPEVLLIVPPSLAGGFASTPEVELGFVRRREVSAEVEWIGRSVALALRNVVVLREIEI